MKASLSLQQSQQLSLTPELKQSLRFLQLPAAELEHEIQELLDTNPLLELEENEPAAEPSAAEAALSRTDEDSSADQQATDALMESDRIDYLADTNDLTREQEFSPDWQESFESKRAPESGSIADTPAGEFTGAEETLFEHLQLQLQLTSLTDKDKLIGETLLHCIDDEGYLPIDPQEVTGLFDPEMEVDKDEVGAVLSLIKTFEPVGIGARDLSERLDLLLAQLPTQEPGLAAARTIVTQHLDLLASHNLVQLKKRLNIDDQQLNSSLALITAQNPRIVNDYQSVQQNYLVPDIIVKKPGDRWVAAINPENQARLRINDTYAKLLKPNLDEAGSTYIQDHLQQARTVIKGLLSRYDTLLLVGQAIVEQQQEFFEHGEEKMKPMVLQDIATALDLHESTVSRATNGKYLLSPRGSYELKFFFSSALGNTRGADSSSTAIRSLIKKMVDAESKQKPLSDNKIAKLLEQQGHIVARRTIAKYRDSMQIASSSLRKSLI